MYPCTSVLIYNALMYDYNALVSDNTNILGNEAEVEI